MQSQPYVFTVSSSDSLFSCLLDCTPKCSPGITIYDMLQRTKPVIEPDLPSVTPLQGMPHHHLPRSSLTLPLSCFPRFKSKSTPHLRFSRLSFPFSTFFALTFIPPFSLWVLTQLPNGVSTSFISHQTSKVIFQKWILIFVMLLLNFIQLFTIVMGRH